MDGIVHLLTVVVTGLLIAFVRKRYPYKKPEMLLMSSKDELARKYVKAEKRIGWLTMLSGAVIIVIFLALRDVNIALESPGPKAVFQFYEGYLIWGLSGFMFFLGAAGHIMGYFQRRFFKNDYDEYIAYSNLKNGYDSWRLLKIISFPFIIIGLSGIYFLGMEKLWIYNDKIVTNEGFSLTDPVYNYNQVKTIRLISDKMPHYVVTFNNGNELNMVDLVTDAKAQFVPVRFISQKSKVKIDTLVVPDN